MRPHQIKLLFWATDMGEGCPPQLAHRIAHIRPARHPIRRDGDTSPM